MGTERAPRGSVSLQQLRYGRRLKYRYHGKEYFLTLPREMPISISKITKVIEADLMMETHDGTQRKYKILIGKVKSTKPALPQSLYNQLRHYLISTGRDPGKNLYRYTLKMVEGWGNISPMDIPTRLTGMNYGASTFNDRKMVLSGFCGWLVRRKILEFNPLDEVPSRKKPGKSANRRYMRDEDVHLVLEAIRLNTYNPVSSRYKHSNYYPIIKFLAMTGARPAEAIGLQVRKVDFRNKVAHIDQSLARTDKGTHAAARKMKSTKTGESREIPMNRELTILLRQQCKNKNPEDLVFTSPTGKSCDDRKMNDNVLAPVLRGLKMEHRVLYFLRHCFVSRCIRSGMDIKSIQKLTGHKDVTVLLQIYAEVTEEKITLPRMKKGPRRAL